MTLLAPDLLEDDWVCSDTGLIAWYPRASHTRSEARTKFWRSTNEATWDVAWTRIRVVARYMRFDPQWHTNEGHYIQCDRGDEGATPVWRCETLGRDGKPMPPEGSRHGRIAL